MWNSDDLTFPVIRRNQELGVTLVKVSQAHGAQCVQEGRFQES